MSKRVGMAWGVAVLLGMAGFCVAALAEVESYKELKGTAPADIIVNATGADSTTATTVIANRMRASNSNPTVMVSCALSGSAADTVVVSCLLFRGGTFIGLQTATATAGSYVNGDGDNICPLLFFDTGGADTYEIRHAAPSAGALNVNWWAAAASSQQ